MVVDSCGRCRHDNEDESTDKVVHTWKCSSKCKPLTEFEVCAILDFKSEFDKPMHELLPILSSCDDGCPILTMVKWCMRQMCLVRVMCAMQMSQHAMFH